MTKRLMAGAMLLATLVGVLYGFPRLSKGGARGSQATISRPRPLPVHAIQIKAADSYEQSRTFTGVIMAGRASDLGFEMGGKVVEVYFDEGQRVTAGQVIARLSTRRFEVQQQRVRSQLKEAVARLQMMKNGPRQETIAAAKAELRSRESNYQLQDKNLARREALLISRAVSAEEVDQSRFGAAAFKAQADAARAQLDALLAGTRDEEVLAQEAVVEQLTSSFQSIQVNLDDSRLQAPFSGTISKRYIDEGSIVSPQSPVVRIVEDQRLEAHVGIPVELAGKLLPGETRQVICGERTLNGKLRSVLPELHRQTQTRVAIFDIESAASELPAIGEMARVEIRRGVDCEGFWLPATAVERGQRGLWSVYVVADDDGGQAIAQRRDVELLYLDQNRMLVRGTLVAGEQVVSGGLHRLAGEQVVTVVHDVDAANVSRSTVSASQLR